MFCCGLHILLHILTNFGLSGKHVHLLSIHYRTVYCISDGIKQVCANDKDCPAQSNTRCVAGKCLCQEPYDRFNADSPCTVTAARTGANVIQSKL